MYIDGSMLRADWAAAAKPAARGGASSFENYLSQARSAGAQDTTGRRNVIVYLPGENCIFSGGHGYDQNVYAAYTEDSTEEDPIVRIMGTASSGSFDFTRHINDIDPANASYAEMCALLGHQRATGAFQPKHASLVTPLPVGAEVGDFMQKRNFLSINREYIAAGIGTQNMLGYGRELLALYESLLQSGKQSGESAFPFAGRVSPADDLLRTHIQF